MRVSLQLLIVALLFSCGKEQLKKVDQALPFYFDASFTPFWIDSSDSKIETVPSIGSFSLLNQEGEVFTQNNVKGKIYIADFFFTTCPGLCPKLGKHMRILQDSITSKEVLLLSHTVMPLHDSVPVLKAFAENNGVQSGKWHLLTGEKKEIYRLARERYHADEDFAKTKDTTSFIHTENFVLVDKKGRIRGVYNGTLLLEMKRLLRHLRVLQKE